MNPLTTLPTSLLALLSTFALPHAYAQGALEIDIKTKVTCSRPTESGDVIAVHYRGSLQTTGAIFDESYKRGEPIKFTLGVGKVIKGWDQGLLDMCPGEQRMLTIPPDLAYGDRGAPPIIPGGATLIFETELVDIIGVEQEKIDVASSSAASSSLPAESATSTEEMFSIATSPSEPPVSENEDVNERPPAGSKESDNDAPPVPPEDVNEKPRPETENTGNDELVAEPLTPPKPASGSPMSTMTEEGECHLLGPFALIVQGALGTVALLSLVYKRWRETPKRPWKIFFFDVSKQVFGSFLTHALNLAMSMLGSVDMVNSAKKAAIAAFTGDAADANTSATQEMPNPCSFYLLNLGIDTTLGIPVLYLLLKILHVAFTYTPLARPRESIKSGHYGNPPRATWWLKQSLIYFIGLTGMKLFVLFLFKALPWLPWVGDWALKWTEGNEALQIAFSMFIFPLAMNAIQYWVIDSFIMEKRAKDSGVAYERVQGEEGDEDDDDDLDGLASVLDEDEEVDGKNAAGFSLPPKVADPIPVSAHSGQSSR